MKIIISIVVIILSIITTAFTQNYKIKKDDFNKTIKQINDSLPGKWSIQKDTSVINEIIIQSLVMELEPDMTSNDPPDVKGSCEIYIMIVKWVSPDSINIIRKRNKELQAQLPEQSSKDNLGNWYNQNEKTLKILDSESTNYDSKFSYRIKCRTLPKNEKDIAEYNQIMAYLNRLFKKYQE